MNHNNEAPITFLAEFGRADVATWMARMLQARGIAAQALTTNVLLQRHTDQDALMDLWQRLPVLPKHVTLLGQAKGVTYVELAGGTVWRWSGETWLFVALSEAWPWHPAYEAVCSAQDNAEGASNDLVTLGAVALALSAEVRALIREQATPFAGAVAKTPFATVAELLDVQTLALIIRDLEDYTGRFVSERPIARVLRLAWAAGNRRVGSDMFGAVVSEYES